MDEVEPPPFPEIVTTSTPREVAAKPFRIAFPGLTGAVKLSMLIVTGLWLIGMPTCAVVSYSGTMSQYEKHDSRYYRDRETRDLSPRAVVDAVAFAGAFSAGLILPTIAFAIAMTVLGVIYFVLRP